MTNQRPQWEDQIYRFHYYRFDKTVTLAGNFFIGLVQQSANLINIGFDASNDNSENTYFNTNGSWQPTEMHGTLMIRPVVGSSYFIGLNEFENVLETVQLYPNPARNVLNIKVTNDTKIIQTSLYDLTGHCVWKGEFTEIIPIDHLNNGLYFISLTTAQGQIITQKFIIRK